MKKSRPDVSRTVTSLSGDALDMIDDVTAHTVKQFDSVLDPVRRPFSQRYPTIFALLGTFGMAATFLGFEQILLASSLLQRHPFFILLLGVGILTVTGTLYKKSY